MLESPVTNKRTHCYLIWTNCNPLTLEPLNNSFSPRFSLHSYGHRPRVKPTRDCGDGPNTAESLSATYISKVPQTRRTKAHNRSNTQNNAHICPITWGLDRNISIPSAQYRYLAPTNTDNNCNPPWLYTTRKYFRLHGNIRTQKWWTRCRYVQPRVTGTMQPSLSNGLTRARRVQAEECGTRKQFWSTL